MFSARTNDPPSRLCLRLLPLTLIVIAAFWSARLGLAQTAQQPGRNTAVVLTGILLVDDEGPPLIGAPLIGTPLIEPPARQVTPFDLPGPRVTGIPAVPPPAPAPRPSPNLIHLPFGGAGTEGRLHVDVNEGRISLSARDAPLDAVLTLICQQHGLSIVGTGTSGQTVTMSLNDVPLEPALDAILRVHGFTWHRDGGLLLVAPLSANTSLPPLVQGRIIQAFPLNYVAAADVNAVVQTLLSPVGKASVIESLPTDRRRTREQVVVEDLRENVERIATYVLQADQPPLQVQIEAKILKVDLRDEHRNGVNFGFLADLAGTNLSLRTAGLANAAANPSLLIGLDGGDLDALIECLQTTTDAKTLASPKVLAVNGQESRIQIGKQLGYFVTTTTQTSTLQNVEFLDVGVVLTVTPTIGDDGQVLMKVKPEVSNGLVNPVTGLPEEDTTEVETTVLLADGQGMIIGGLIQEIDSDLQNKVPLLGDLWFVGRLFRRTITIRQRSEIIIALTPRIIPHPACRTPREEFELMRINTPLLVGPLQRVDRTAFEPQLPDASHNPRRLAPRRLPDAIGNVCEDRPLPATHYFPIPAER